MSHAATLAITQVLGAAPVLWSGKPRPRAALLTWLPIWIIAVPWIGLALSALVQAVGLAAKSEPTQLARLGAAIAVLFLAGGVAMLLSPVFAARSARRTVYALGSDRLWQLDLRGKSRPVSYDLARVLSTERTERADGSGTLSLLLGSRDAIGRTLQTETVVLRSVPDVRRLEHLILQQGERVRRAA